MTKYLSGQKASKEDGKSWSVQIPWSMRLDEYRSDRIWETTAQRGRSISDSGRRFASHRSRFDNRTQLGAREAKTRRRQTKLDEKNPTEIQMCTSVAPDEHQEFTTERNLHHARELNRVNMYVETSNVKTGESLRDRFPHSMHKDVSDIFVRFEMRKNAE